MVRAFVVLIGNSEQEGGAYSTVTLLARFLG